MEDRIQAQHDWLGWGFGHLLWLQEHSNNRGLKWTAGSAPCTSGSWRGQGEFTDFEHNGKKKQNHTTLRPHKPQIRSLTGPSQAKLSGGALCYPPPPQAHHGATAVFGYGTGIQQSSLLFIQRITEGINWDIPGVKKTQNRSWAHSSGNLLSVCTRAGTYC